MNRPAFPNKKATGCVGSRSLYAFDVVPPVSDG